MALTKNKTIFFALLLLTGFIMTDPVPVSAEGLSYAEAINKAGRQRMLTQRITKSYCQLGLEVAPEKSQIELEEAINLFSSQLQDLKQFSTEEEVKKILEDIEAQWGAFRKLALSVPARENARQLAKMDEELLHASEQLVQILENLSSIPTSRLVNISGRQRMLSQRLTKFYMLNLWGLGSHAINSEIDRATNEFKGALDSLIEAPENTIIIKEKLDDAKLQWAWLNSSLNFSQDEHFPLIALDASDKMLQIMEKVTGLYQKVSENN